MPDLTKELLERFFRNGRVIHSCEIRTCCINNLVKEGGGIQTQIHDSFILVNRTSLLTDSNIFSMNKFPMIKKNICLRYLQDIFILILESEWRIGARNKLNFNNKYWNIPNVWVINLPYFASFLAHSWAKLTMDQQCEMGWRAHISVQSIH
jgi:hypothetical protein